MEYSNIEIYPNSTLSTLSLVKNWHLLTAYTRPPSQGQNTPDYV